MSDKIDEFTEFPRWLQRILPLISLILAILAFSYSMYLYNQESLVFVQWIRLIIFAIMGLVLLFSTIFYFFNDELAWKWLVGGLTLLPILLLLQLILFLIHIIKTGISSVFAGSLPEPIRIFLENYPSKFDIVILSVLFIVGVLWIVDKLKKSKK
ncbi:hypothetical protein J14TS2_33950 [Bacillus sp. J14TS2]|uniref:hypothetical protein n=1 Tax=Bacillus sp. J14TS2 TaxID=2807188 RepID=UPI001B2DA76B|nr:hypothetical protein [Bacillus sp. J14TS2]GIN72920.1 hypothetical protein J14TS2_33950 [Bacillus sp. J14TS2]